MAEQVDKEILCISTSKHGGYVMIMFANGTYDIRDTDGWYHVQGSQWRIQHEWLYFKHAGWNDWSSFEKETYDVVSIMREIEAETALRKIFA